MNDFLPYCQICCDGQYASNWWHRHYDVRVAFKGWQRGQEYHYQVLQRVEQRMPPSRSFNKVVDLDNQSPLIFSTARIFNLFISFNGYSDTLQLLYYPIQNFKHYIPYQNFFMQRQSHTNISHSIEFIKYRILINISQTLSTTQTKTAPFAFFCKFGGICNKENSYWMIMITIIVV